MRREATRTQSPEYVHDSTVRRLNLALWRSGETGTMAVNEKDGTLSVHRTEGSALVLVEVLPAEEALEFAKDLERSLTIKDDVLGERTSVE